MPYFEALVGRFYDGVAVDPELRAIYPEADLAPARRRLTLFLAHMGRPDDLQRRARPPRLRMRHFPFAIGTAERDRWLSHMRTAIDEVPAPDDVRVQWIECRRSMKGGLPWPSPRRGSSALAPRIASLRARM